MKKKLLRIFLFIMTLLSCIVPSENNGPKRVEAATTWELTIVADVSMFSGWDNLQGYYIYAWNDSGNTGWSSNKMSNYSGNIYYKKISTTLSPLKNFIFYANQGGTAKQTEDLSWWIYNSNSYVQNGTDKYIYINPTATSWNNNTFYGTSITSKNNPIVSYYDGSVLLKSLTHQIYSTFSSYTPTKTGYTFKGWYTSSSGGSRVTTSNKITSNTTVYAQWEANEYSITYSGLDNATISTNPTSYNIETDTFALNNPSKEGYTFTGWTGSNGTTPSTSVTISKGTYGALSYTANWQINQYNTSISVDPTNGGSVSWTDETENKNASEYDYGTSITFTASPSDGYHFDGWYNSSDTNTLLSEDTTYTKILGTDGISLVAKFKGNEYTLTLDSNGGDTLSLNTITVTYGSPIGELPDPTYSTDPSQIFIGWFTAASGGTEVTSETNYEVVGNSTIYAQWKQVPKHNVTLNLNTGNEVTDILKTIEVYETLKYSFKNDGLPTPVRTGYTFKEWNTVTDGSGETITDDTIVSENNRDHILYAIWTANNYTLSYDVNTGDTSLDSKTVTYDSTYGELPTPTKKGYTFDGWFTASSGGTKVTSETQVTTADDHTIYAHWTANTYTITFNANGAEGSMNDLSMTYDVSKTLTTNSFTKTGYTFCGWNTEANGTGTAYTDSKEVSNLTSTNNGIVTLYAQWGPNNYFIAYNANDGIGSMTTVETEYGKTLSLSTNTFTRTGYTFKEWNTKSDGTGTAYTNCQEVSNLTTVKNGTVTLYAQWTPITYTIEFNNNGGEGTMTSLSATYDESQTLTENSFTRTGYTFAGWATSANGDVVYTDEASVSNLTSTDGATVTLYAKWTPITYNVILYENFEDSSETHPFTATYDVNYDKSSIFENDGYQIKGWSLTKDGDIVYNPNEIINLTSETTNTPIELYAIWECIEYNIYYTLNNGSWESGENPNPTLFNITTSNISIENPVKNPYTFIGWTCSQLDINDPTTELIIEKGSYLGNIELVAHWDAYVTVYIDAASFADKLGDSNVLYYESFTLHYWEEEGNGTDWNDRPSMTHTGKDHIYSYSIHFDDTITKVDYIIIVFKRKENGEEKTTQTTDIEIINGWTAENNGEEYFFALPNSFGWENDNGNWKINNISHVGAPRVAYYDDSNDEPVYISSYLDNHKIKFIEKEGYRLVGWYLDPTFDTLFTKDTEITESINVYAKYIEAHDYYLYCDAKDLPWKLDNSNMYVYMYNEYFYDPNTSQNAIENTAWGNNSYGGDSTCITYVGNGIYRVFIDTSKSFNKIIFSTDDPDAEINQTADIEMSINHSYYVLTNVEGTNSGGTDVYEIFYEENLDNFLVAQKNTSSDTNAFRFTTGLESNPDEGLTTGNKEFGYKFIFIKDSTTYVGYWNFSKDGILDCVNYEGTLYEAGVDNKYKGYYSLTLTDSITFNYSDYDQIIVIGCYRDSNNLTRIIKAQEYNIVGTGSNVQLYEIERE